MEELLQRLDELDSKLTATKQSVDRIRQYFKWTMILSLVFFVIPLIGMLFALPKIMNVLTGNIVDSGLL